MLSTAEVSDVSIENAGDSGSRWCTDVTFVWLLMHSELADEYSSLAGCVPPERQGGLHGNERARTQSISLTPRRKMMR